MIERKIKLSKEELLRLNFGITLIKNIKTPKTNQNIKLYLTKDISQN